MSDDLRDQIAVFYWNGTTHVVEVCGLIVADLTKLADVKAFSDMHNGRLLG